jgi:hypothetical protein
MSLLVYSDGALYADNRFVLEVSGMQDVYINDKKIYVDHKKYFAVGVVGPYVADPLMQEMMPTFSTIGLLDTLWRRHELEQDKRDICRKFAQKLSIDLIRTYAVTGTTFIVISRKGAFKISNIGYDVLVEANDTVIGSGTSTFMMMRLAGYSVEEAYRITNRNCNSVGPLTQKVSRDQLKQWPASLRAVTNALKKGNSDAADLR